MSNSTLEIPSEVIKRLEEELVIWLTTVSANGAPHPNPVWFYWDGKNILIYSKPTSFKIKNIECNPAVALNLGTDDPNGGRVVIFNGKAILEKNQVEVNPGFASKYMETTKDLGTTPQQLIKDYSILIRITPDKLLT